ncbi:hypothetical protein BDI4_1070025 [Burkholderia diffusa]|nr:hypothetical protein BDI4_1070025 [Burkholderia diffusa]
MVAGIRLIFKWACKSGLQIKSKEDKHHGAHRLDRTQAGPRPVRYPSHRPARGTLGTLGRPRPACGRVRRSARAGR